MTLTREEILAIREEMDIVPGRKESQISVNKKRAVINNGLNTRFKKGVILPFHFKTGNKVGKETRFHAGDGIKRTGRPKGSGDKVKRAKRKDYDEFYKKV